MESLMSRGCCNEKQLELNGELPDELVKSSSKKIDRNIEYTDGAGQESLTRFEKDYPMKKKKRRPLRNQQRNS